MRPSRAASLVLLAGIAVPEAAQGQKQFEGQVSMELAGDKGRSTTTESWIKGGKMRMEMSSGGRMFVMIADHGASKTLMLMPQQKTYMERPMPMEDAVAKSKAKVTRTGRSDVVAGHKCEIIRVEDKGNVTEVCGATNMGKFVVAGGPGLRRGQVSWGKGLDGFFPLRVADDSGKAVLRVTKIERKRVADSQFLPPPDYTPMAMKLPARR